MRRTKPKSRPFHWPNSTEKSAFDSHWHDAAAVRFGYPRLSCCIEVEKPMTVRLLDKHVWGQVLPR